MKFFTGKLFVALLLAGNAWSQGVITSFVGGNWVFTGNGQPAMNAPLGTISGVTFDPAGNLVIVDRGNCLVERINPNGTVSVIAGNGFYFFVLHTGDGGPAVNAELGSPTAAAYDSHGNLYIAEADRVSEVSPQGTINTIAGGGFDATSNGIPALKAAVSPDRGLVVASTGAIYFSEASGNRVREVKPDGTIVTVAGTGVAGYSGDGGMATAAKLNVPYGLALDKAGNLYIADNGNSSVRRVTPAGVISTVATGIEASGLAVNNNGDLYMAGGGFIVEVAAGSSTLIPVGGSRGVTGFSGDGGPALAAQFSQRLSVVADNLGNLFIGDGTNERIRQISASGVVTTIAGNGQFYYTGEGVPAAASPVQGGGNLAIDKAGNIYFSDTLGSRVRKVTGGVINTVAGTGVAGFSGDNGPALQAKLSAPRNLALDSAGNLYIADYLNNRVRRVALDGTISTYAQLPGKVRGLVFDATENLYAAVETNSTVYRIDAAGKQTVFAGTGSAGLSGDGGPASQAMLNSPAGLAIDTQGNIYIADAQNGRVRMVNPKGVISTFVSIPKYYGSDFPPIPRELAFDQAGTLYVSDDDLDLVLKVTPAMAVSIFAGGGGFFPGDGYPATEASFEPFGIVLDASGNLYIDDTWGIQVVLATPPTISLQQSSLSFSAASGGAPATQTAAVLGSVPSLGFAVSVKTATGGNWLTSNTKQGLTPQLLSITADPLNLAPGTYTGTLTITPTAATPATLSLAVTFTVGAALPPTLGVDQTNLSFTYPKGAPARSATLKISNLGGGSLAFTASATTNTGGSWLTVTPKLGNVVPGTPVALTVTADPLNLPPGTYTGSVTIQSAGGGTVTVPVNLAISSLSKAILLTQTGMSFTAVAQGGVVPPQTFGVVNLGTGSLPWTSSVSTLAGGNWLSATPVSGSSDPSLPAPQVTVSVNVSGLAAGDYYGLVRIDAPGAANSPQFVTAFLSVLPVGSDPGASVQPSELFFTTTPNGENPGSQQVLVYNIGAAPQTFFVAFASIIPENYIGFEVLPDTEATLDPTRPTPVVVQPFTSGSLPAGTYTEFESFQFSDGRVQTVKVNVIVAPAGSGAKGNVRPDTSAPACVPTTLIPALPSLSPAFSVSAGWPVALSAVVIDDCGNPQTSGSVTVSFSTGDPPLALNSLNDGTWQGTWSASLGSGKPVSMIVKAVDNQRQLSGTREVDGGIVSPKTPPAFTQAGIVSAASPVSFTSLAPGSIISIYGSFLADGNASAQSIPLPTTLGNASVVIAGQLLPLFYASPGQINALVPFGLNTNTTHQLLIQRDLTLSTAVPINISDAQPGTFQTGGNALAVDYRTPPTFLVTPTAPAQAGDVLVFYCGGLGLTMEPVTDGGASPSTPTQAPVTMTIGGQNANVIYAGLVAGLVGLYQVNVTMPGGVAPGNAVPVVLTVAGQTSPAAYISTQ